MKKILSSPNFCIIYKKNLINLFPLYHMKKIRQKRKKNLPGQKNKIENI